SVACQPVRCAYGANQGGIVRPERLDDPVVGKPSRPGTPCQVGHPTNAPGEKGRGGCDDPAGRHPGGQAEGAGCDRGQEVARHSELSGPGFPYARSGDAADEYGPQDAQQGFDELRCVRPATVAHQVRLDADQWTLPRSARTSCEKG